MSLRSLLFLAMAAPATAYEWYAVFKLERGTEYRINLGKAAFLSTDGGHTWTWYYADPAMRLYFAEVNEGAAIDAVAASHAATAVRRPSPRWRRRCSRRALMPSSCARS